MTEKKFETIYEEIPSGYVIRRTYKNRNIKLEIEPGIYRPLYNHETGELRLEPMGKKFVVPVGKRYGIYNQTKEAIINGLQTQTSRPIGILAMGDPGAGKTLIGKEISNYLIDAGMHVIFIDTQFPLDILRDLTQMMCPAVFFLDEFSKNFYGENQYASNNHVHAQFLSILEDHTLSGNVYFMTCNTNDVNRLEGIRSRPGRVMFNIPTEEMLITGTDELLRESKLPKDIASLLRLCILGGKSGTTENRFNLDNLQKMISYYKPGMSFEQYLLALMPYNLPKLRMPELKFIAALKENPMKKLISVLEGDTYKFYEVDEKNERIEPAIDQIKLTPEIIANAAFGKYGYRDRIRLSGKTGKVKVVSNCRIDFGHFDTVNVTIDFDVTRCITLESAVNANMRGGYDRFQPGGYGDPNQHLFK